MTIEFKSLEEAKCVLHCLKRTFAIDRYGGLTNILDTVDEFEFRLWELIRVEEEKIKSSDSSTKTLITDPNDQPAWIELEEGLSKYREFELGETFTYNKSFVKIIHIQQSVSTVLFRLLFLNNNATTTVDYHTLHNAYLEP